MLWPVIAHALQRSSMGGAFRKTSSLRKSYLDAEDGGLDQLQRLAVDLDQALASLALSDSLFNPNPVSKKSPRSRCFVVSVGHSFVWDMFIVGQYAQSRFSSCRSTEPSEGRP